MNDSKDDWEPGEEKPRHSQDTVWMLWLHQLLKEHFRPEYSREDKARQILRYAQRRKRRKIISRYAIPIVSCVLLITFLQMLTSSEELVVKTGRVQKFIAKKQQWIEGKTFASGEVLRIIGSEEAHLVWKGGDLLLFIRYRIDMELQTGSESGNNLEERNGPVRNQFTHKYSDAGRYFYYGKRNGSGGSDTTGETYDS